MLMPALFFYQGFEDEIAEAATEEQKTDSLMRLSWALVHSRQPEDVNRGIGMLQGNDVLSVACFCVTVGAC
jgi:hypothetical protein